MADMRREEEEAKKNAKGRGKQVEHYSGGERSGMATLGPEDVGGQSSDPNDPWAAARAAGALLGQGEQPADANSSTITIYADGFTVNNGPLRPMSDPANKKFMDDIHSGVCPDELKKEGIYLFG